MSLAFCDICLGSFHVVKGDRNLWYVDDWDERFNDTTSFLVYEHPRGLNLSEDFEVLIAALEMGAYLRRRVVLPDRMNCANSPAYNIYNLSETMLDEPGCTYDYFAHANGLYEVYSRVKFLGRNRNWLGSKPPKVDL